MEAQSSPTKNDENVSNMKNKPGPKPKAKVDVDALQEELTTLKAAFSRLAVMTGHGNMLIEYGIERWTPGKKQMNKYG